MKTGTTGACPVYGLYAIADTNYLNNDRLVPAVARALCGGARVIQYRDKSNDRALREHQARALRQLCRAHEACFVINDDPGLARAVSADGLHLGRDDVSIAVARAIMGDDAIIGMSCYNDGARAETAVAAGADYVAFGSFYPSPTKPDAVHADPALLRDARARLRVPLVAIGGITPENGAVLVAAGADALAVISGVFDQPDIEAAAQRYAALFQKNQ